MRSGFRMFDDSLHSKALEGRELGCLMENAVSWEFINHK